MNNNNNNNEQKGNLGVNNNLHLNFQLETIEERTQFLNTYLNSPNAPSLSSKDLDTCANYVLWGKEADGKSPAQKGIYVPTKKSTWRKKNKEQSLEQLMEHPTFNEGLFADPTLAPRKAIRQKLNRDKERQRAPQRQKQLLEELWQEIDQLDLEIGLWTEKHKEKPIRQELLDRFLPEHIAATAKKINTFSANQILAKKHLLVEKRQEQFLIRETYVLERKKRQSLKEVAAATSMFFAEKPTWENGIDVFPLGLTNKNNISDEDFLKTLIFEKRGQLEPGHLNEKAKKKISDFVWEKKEQQKNQASKPFFDFRNEHHVAELLAAKWHGELDSGLDDFESTTKQILDTLDFYIEWAHFEEKFLMILAFKGEEKKNKEIARLLNERFGTKHSDNYVSVLFRQKIVKRICNAATEHEEVMNKIFFDEEFKKCRLCGSTLLLNRDNYVKKKKAVDGFCSACRSCEKKIRDGKKKGGNKQL